MTLTIAYSQDLTVRVPGNDGKIHEVKSLKPLYTGDVHTIPLDVDPATVQPSARVETRGTEVLLIREIGPWGARPVWAVLSDLLAYLNDRVIVPFKPFFMPPLGASGAD